MRGERSNPAELSTGTAACKLHDQLQLTAYMLLFLQDRQDHPPFDPPTTAQHLQRVYSSPKASFSMRSSAGTTAAIEARRWKGSGQ